MHHRLAKELARIEHKYKNGKTENEIYEILKDFKYIIPQGGPMSGIGNNKQIVSLSNCFVIGYEHDSYGSIMKVDEQQVQLMKRRGGVGHDLSHIRPKGYNVKNSALTSTGIVPFMERYSNSTREVGQDGRRGALMLSFDIRHPNANDFMDAKMEDGKITGANISLKLNDDFMKAVINDTTFFQQYPVISNSVPTFSEEIEAKPLFNKIVHNAWKSAEPGILFWDTVINESVSDCYSDEGFKTVSTNPCGEIPLPPYDSCRLLAINLYSYVKQPFTKKATFDYELFKKHAEWAQRIMDDIVDLEIEKIEKILEKIESDNEPEHIKNVEKELWLNMINMAKKGRRTGIGITAEGDMLAAMGLTYGTTKATKFSTEIHKQLALNVYKASCKLAKDRGSFEMWDFNKEVNNPFIKRLIDADSELKELMKHGRRNVSLLTIAPTGSVSLMTQTTSGIEPAFLVAYKRRRKINPNDKNTRVDYIDENGDSWEEYTVVHHKFKIWMSENGYDTSDMNKYSSEDLNEMVKKSSYFNATSNDVDWVEKVKMQGAIQKWVDHSISVTVNLPKDTTEEIVAKVYTTAWEAGCKGVTVYRDGSRSGVLISDSKKSETNVNEIIKQNNAPKRPKRLKCEILRFQNNKEKWIGFTGLLENEPYEVFTGLLESISIPNYIESGWIVKNRDKNGKSRYDFEYTDRDGYIQTYNGLSRAFNKEYWNYGKLISGVIRHGMPIPNLINLIDSLDMPDSIVSWKSGVKRMLKKHIKDETESNDQKCPMCGNTLTFTDGCLSCIDTKEQEGCGWSKCG
jgi:ribonucleoside-diphosphate reductase alpha chain